jgi:DNA repair exonuclease SbcCD ATPase subunit
MTSYLTQVIDKKEFWVKATQQEIEILKNDKSILLKQIESLKAFDPQIEKYDNAQKQILEKNNQIDILNQKITKFNTTKDQIENKIEEGKNVLNDHATDLGNIKNNINLLTIKISENKNKIDKITKLENGVTCNHCLSIIDKNSYFHVEQECNTNLNSLVSNKNELENNQKDLLEKINDVKADLQKILDLKIKINTSLNDAKNNIQFLQNEIKNLN